jgi:hypothetical protein
MDFGVPLQDARVTIVELRLETVTADQGQYLLEDVPAGR